MSGQGNKGSIVPRIVMIDDEPNNLKMIRVILSSERFLCELNMFEEGQKALDHLSSHPTDLILLDLSMPTMDGFEVISRVKNDPAISEIPVIFLSAYHDTNYILRAFQLGATDFIGKPIIAPLLIARIRNVLETRRLQTQLMKSNKDLVTTNQLKDDLLSICSHDLRGPLSSIDLLCQFMNDSLAGTSDEPPEEVVSRIAGQSRMARRLVENLLDMSKIEEGRLLPQPSIFMLGDLIATSAENELPLLEAKNLSQTVEGPEEELLCYGDREMLGQVLHNVLNNAAKHAEHEVGLHYEIAGFTEEAGATARILITDDGPGIPPDLRQQVFEKFSKGEPHGGGSGLGLYISRQMIGLLQGSISIEEAKDGHTMVDISIPNIFKIGQLPDLHPYIHRRALVLSESKGTRELLISLLSEAGMMDVIPIPRLEILEKDGSPMHTESGELPVMVVDAENLNWKAMESGESLHGNVGTVGDNSRMPWLIYGPQGAAENIAGRISAPHQIVASPLNALVFLKAMETLLAFRRNLSIEPVVN